jgi:hypothetical protein
MSMVLKILSGHEVLIDAADYPLLSQYKWCRTSLRAPYARTEFWQGGKRYQLLMHSLLLNPPIGFEVDHINGNGMDNRRANIRIATHSENCANRCNNRKGGYRGVYLTKSGTFEVKLMKRPNLMYLGKYTDEIEAARVYDKAAREAFGEFARLNFPEAA